ncbi:uncharacterized protein SPPG_07466 [Spizellomyces punctatus DAOM BR117]|uniref:Diacylglycerol O-acyltransferase n=1 Tax=Spizellomyces punctatus (strain DAOM BR117) TaxID=645134 RepID=A0A0L0H6H7_SPIPD|nr:uncharacterized protein SPPG_07466 [Spizellomyces punctatus DAOM BR117]KNC97070.1 hypothetical protein SPPG_07466 [Spizellomyces punctatus DAOM BR117]|eukprot:XP_016605110.1 hypothetical protein SPPG_07466 [Spizellomyces punctatus DAOM BR117]
MSLKEPSDSLDSPRFVDAPAMQDSSVKAKATATKAIGPYRKSDIFEILAVLCYTCIPHIELLLHVWFFYNWRYLWPFAVMYWTFAYFIDVDTPYTGGTDRWRFIRDWSFWKYFRDYFSAELIKTADLDPRGNYLFGYHPHGIYCYGLLPNFITDVNNFSGLFPGIKLRMTTLDLNWSIPLWRESQMAFGVISVSAKSLKHVLTKKGPGWSTMVVVGGADEALLSYPGTNDIVIDRRKGFIKIAIQTGASLVPVFTFGENDLFWQVTDANAPSIRKIQNSLTKKMTFSLPLIWGRFGPFPRKVKIVSVVGAPIPVTKQENPSREYVAAVHKQYVDALVKLYHDHKDKYAVDRISELKIVK